MTKKIGLWSAIFLGMGSMIGAGIFALMGQAGAIAGNQVYLSFIFGGIIALLSGYSFAKLAQRYPSRGGLIEYLTQTYGEGFFSGAISILFYLSAIIAIAMVAKTFGIYATHLFGLKNIVLATDILSISLLAFLVIVNLSGAYFASKFENIIVVFKIGVLVFLGVLSLIFIKPGNLTFISLPGISNVFYSIGLTFFAFEGFRVITNTVEDLEDSKKNIMKAMMFSILLVLGIYVIISLGVFGNFNIHQVQTYKEYVLAKVAEKVFGLFGYILISITALISTTSSVNANLYAISNVTYTMAKEGELPKKYSKKFYQNYEGLVISSLIIAGLIIFFNISQIAIIGSISILLVHLLVHIGHLLKLKETKAKRSLIILAITGITAVIALILIYTYKSTPNIILYLLLGIIIAIALELSLRIKNKRIIKKQIT